MAVPQRSTHPVAAPRVAFQGEPGAFSEEAVLALWPNAAPVPTRSIGAVTEAVVAGHADNGMLPVENTVAGGVVAAYDALADAPTLHVIGEVILRIHQCLVGMRGADIERLESVESHPVALAQCSEFLRRHPRVEEHAASDTASAARAIAEARNPRRAAIASEHAARRYGLAILAWRIENRADNQTRFLAIAREPVFVRPETPARTSLIFTTANEPGALIRALEPIAHQQLSLSRLESRPTGEPWTYRFFADVDHAAGDPRIDAALEAMSHATQTCRILGTYARAAT